MLHDQLWPWWINPVIQIDSSTSDHEEANTHMLSHIAKIMEDKPSSKFLVKCQDTDVFLSCLSLVDELPSQKLICSCGKKQLRYVNRLSVYRPHTQMMQSTARAPCSKWMRQCKRILFQREDNFLQAAKEQSWIL